MLKPADLHKAQPSQMPYKRPKNNSHCRHKGSTVRCRSQQLTFGHGNCALQYSVDLKDCSSLQYSIVVSFRRKAASNLLLTYSKSVEQHCLCLQPSELDLKHKNILQAMQRSLRVAMLFSEKGRVLVAQVVTYIKPNTHGYYQAIWS